MSAEVAAYLAAVPPDRQARVSALHEMVLRLYPGACVDMRYRMPTYRVGDGWVAIANQKHYVSLYTCGYDHIRRFRQRFPAIRTGKGCINLTAGDDMPWAELEPVIRHALEHPKPWRRAGRGFAAGVERAEARKQSWQKGR